MSTKNGFGLIEIIIALALFVIIGTTGLTLILHSFSLNRLGQEQTTATTLAESGLEITRHLRDQSWGNLVDGTYGLQSTNGIWSLTAEPETWQKYTRTITINPGRRDGSGNLVDSGGTIDPDTKKITSTTNWTFAGLRLGVITLSQHLTNFTKAIADLGDAILVWGDTTTTPKWNFYTNNTDIFGTINNFPTGQSARNSVVQTSPTKAEAIMGYVGNTGILHIFCQSGGAWIEEWSATVGGTGTTRRFDVGYETNTGDVMVVYSTNTATNNEMAYRTKLGTSGCGTSNWSSATNLSAARTTGIIQWIKIAQDPGVNQNVLGLIWADANQDLSAMLWDGSSWVNEPSTITEASLEIVTTAVDVESFDLAFESISGNLMIIWGNSAGTNAVNGVRYRRCTGGTALCTWGAVTTPPTFVDDATNLDLASDPGSNNMVFASTGNAGSDLQTGYWNGSAWTNTANVDTTTTTPAAGTKKVATTFLRNGATVRSVIVYDDSGGTRVDWRSGNATTFTNQTDWPTTNFMTTNRGWYEFYQDPTTPDSAMLITADGSNRLWAKKVTLSAAGAFTWSDSDASTPLTTTLSQRTTMPFSMAYWRNP